MLSQLLYKLTHWETWHYHAKYIPLLPAWAWYCIRSGSPWFFTSSNPTLTFGGMEGESKREMYSQMPPGTYPDSIYIKPEQDFDQVLQMVNERGFRYPFIVKPNVGMMGFMFRKIDNEGLLRRYHATMQSEYLVQEFVDYPVEVSVFYYRHPDELKGTISGFLKKESPYVIGDGKSTLLELMQQHETVKHKIDELKHKHTLMLNEVIEKDRYYILSLACNRSQGGKLVSLEQEIDETLLELFDRISHYSGHFLYGRYDIKCASVDDLKAGRNYKILEYNGSGSGTQHVYGNNKSLLEASRIILHHWKMLYTISVANRKKGYSHWKFTSGLKLLINAKKNLRLLKRLDASFPAN